MIREYLRLMRARPPLSLVSPLAFYIVIGFVMFNFWIAVSLAAMPQIDLIVITSIFTKYFWSAVYLIMALGLAVSLVLNDWKAIRFFMGSGVFVKTLFTYALVYLGLRYGFVHISSTLTLWLFAAWVQIITVIYFTPNGRVDYGKPAAGK